MIESYKFSRKLQNLLRLMIANSLSNILFKQVKEIA